MNLVNVSCPGLVGTDSRYGDFSDFPKQTTLKIALCCPELKCLFVFKRSAALLRKIYWMDGYCKCLSNLVQVHVYVHIHVVFMTKTWKWFAVVFIQDTFLASQSWHFLEASHSIISNPTQLFKITQNHLGEMDISQQNEVFCFARQIGGGTVGKLFTHSSHCWECRHNLIILDHKTTYR